MGNKSTPAVNILALAVTLFGAFSYLKTAPCVCCMTTLWTIHHIQIPTFAIRIIVMIHKNINIENTLFHFKIINLHFEFNTGCKTVIRADGMCQSRNGPFRIIYRLFKTTDLHRHFRVEICPPFCQL
ncbi:Uncharacterised protein [Escherichia coli]|nr:Uncharacterised protein [Escherichia coli]